jgi:hypothetical protein
MDASKFTRGLGRTKLFLGKNSPEILLVVGIVAGLTGAYFAAKVTEEARQEVEATKEEAEEVMTKAQSDEYTETDQQKELGMVVIKGSLQVAKLYAPAIGFGVLSITALLMSHNIMTRRMASLSTAYSMAVEALSLYRKRVIEEYGEDADLIINRSMTEKKDLDEDGNETTTVEWEARPGIYGAYFDEGSREFRETYEMNLFFLQSQEKVANQMLKWQGHVFLNEVFDMLGLPRTSIGAIVGWKYQHDPKKNNDGYISFDTQGIYNEANSRELRASNPRFLLDFNVDGEIYKLI